MNDTQRLQLQNMIKTNNVEDQTEFIRSLKHSDKIREEVEKMLLIKQQFQGNDEKIHEECVKECLFLYTGYTEIYNKVRKDEIDVNILYRFLNVLKQIETGELDQHEGSFLVGTILKELYIDSALKKADKLNITNDNNAEPKKAAKQISYKEFIQK